MVDLALEKQQNTKYLKLFQGFFFVHISLNKLSGNDPESGHCLSPQFLSRERGQWDYKVYLQTSVYVAYKYFLGLYTETKIMPHLKQF
jgi:hypothetical protein